MAGKSELSAAPGVQNVLVYVSNDNFAQAYAVEGHSSAAPPSTHHGGGFHPQQKPPFFSNLIAGPGGYHPQQVVNNYYHLNDSRSQPAPPPPVKIRGLEDVQLDGGGYQIAVSASTPPHNVRCDSVRSETAESSCSSLSSADEGGNLVLVHPQPPPNQQQQQQQQPPPELLVYDSVNVRPSAGVVLTTTPQLLGVPAQPPPQQPPPSITVPYGWKRLLNNGAVIYISPSNTALSSPEQVKEYLLTAGTCKCGLECHFKYDNVFNFDPKVSSKPWVLLPDSNTGDLTKLCNHKRKILAMAALDCKPPDPNIKLRKEFNVKRKKRKVDLPYMIAPPPGHRDKIHHQATFNGTPPQIWSSQNPRLQTYQDNSQNRIIFNPDGTTMMLHHPQSPNISPQQPPAPPPSNPNINIQHHQVIGPNGQIISLQGPNIPPQPQRIFVNNQPEASGPGRPLQMIPVSISNPPSQRMPFYTQYHQRPFHPQNGFRPQPPQKVWTTNQNRNNNMQLQNQYDRVPPLHQHTPQQPIWPEEVKRKKVKLAKVVKNRPYHLLDNCQTSPCPNIDVRQIPGGEAGRAVIINTNQSAASPSFLEDPSGYLAQQTALLNNTINRQTGCSGFVCNSPVTSIPQQIQPAAPQPQNIVATQHQSNEVPLPSSMIMSQLKHPSGRTKTGYANQSLADSAMEHNHPQYSCQGCIADSQFVKGHNSRPNSQPGTPSSSGEDPVTSSTYEKHQASPDSRPIQGGTVSTSNVSPVDGSGSSGPPTPNPTPTPPQRSSDTFYQDGRFLRSLQSGLVTTMASGRTVGSNTITSVLAGRANTATVSINNGQNQGVAVNVSKSPLEMVQSVVSSIQVPKSSSGGLPPGHILVSSGGQLIMASTGGSGTVMAPPPPKLLQNQNSMPPISVSPMVTNVTASVAQVIPAVAQQVLGQQTVLVNALPQQFVLQPGVTMTMDGVGNMQLPQLVAGNVIQQQIQLEDPRRSGLLSPESKKKGKKRKMSQTVASMLHIAAQQQNPGMVMQSQTFPQQIMSHNPSPVMQALTIVPSKTGGPPQLTMTNQPIINSQPTQQINLLQPVNLINGTNVVQNFPFQQFIVPNLGGMVMNPDGTATILQETPNLGMQLQIQNVNGQNVLTPVQNQMFNNNQSILAAGPAGMVIRAPTSQSKLIQPQQHSPGAATQFLSPNTSQFVVNGTQFSGQLSPLVASVSPSQVTFNSSRNNPQDFMQTLMVPCTPVTSSNTTFVQQNTTIVQQQTTMVSNQNQTQAVVVQQRQSPQSSGYRQSVSTQTAVNQNSQAVTTNTFCQTSTISAGSPPDTTTLSPMASGGQSPPTADTTTHSGASTDDGLSPAPSNCANAMAMVHCISSSEPDSAELSIPNSELDWRQPMTSTPKPPEFTDISALATQQMQFKKGHPTHVTFAESTLMPGLQFLEQLKPQDSLVSSRNYELLKKKKGGEMVVVMDSRHLHHEGLFEEEVEFSLGDLVFGPTNGCAAWPGKIVQVLAKKKYSVKWFGEKNVTIREGKSLQSLSQGLEAQHLSRRTSRTSRKLNGQLEKAIQEAMLELDKKMDPKSTSKPIRNTRKASRLRSSPYH